MLSPHPHIEEAETQIPEIVKSKLKKSLFVNCINTYVLTRNCGQIDDIAKIRFRPLGFVILEGFLKHLFTKKYIKSKINLGLVNRTQ